MWNSFFQVTKQITILSSVLAFTTSMKYYKFCFKLAFTTLMTYCEVASDPKTITYL